jgi:hypothetical protein
MDTHTFRTVTRISAPIFSSFSRSVAHCAFVHSVPCNLSHRGACISQYATSDRNNLGGLGSRHPAREAQLQHYL